MENINAEIIAHDLMNRHKLNDWNFIIDKIPGVAVCCPEESKIWISSVYLPDMKEDEFRNIILHEIAHVLVWKQYPENKKPHGPIWKKICLSIGGTGEKYEI
jgi:hypothetical protein